MDINLEEFDKGLILFTEFFQPRKVYTFNFSKKERENIIKSDFFLDVAQMITPEENLKLCIQIATYIVNQLNTKIVALANSTLVSTLAKKLDFPELPTLLSSFDSKMLVIIPAFEANKDTLTESMIQITNTLILNKAMNMVMKNPKLSLQGALKKIKTKCEKKGSFNYLLKLHQDNVNQITSLINEFFELLLENELYFTFLLIS